MNKLKRRIASILTAAAVAFASVTMPDIGILSTFSVPASAETHTVTKTVTWKMDGGDSGETTLLDDYTLYTTAGGANNSLHWTCNDPNPYNNPQIKLVNSTFFGDHYAHTYFMGDVLNSDPSIEFLDIEGTVTKVEMVNFQLAGDGVQMFAGKDSSNTATLLHLQNTTDVYDVHSIGGIEGQETFSSATFVGNVNVDINNPLKILFIGTVTEENRWNGCTFDFKSDGSGYIAVTYETEEEVTGDPGHTFSYTTSGDTLTATCNQTDPNHNCGLTDHKATLKLSADDVPYNGLYHTASVNKQEFVNATGITDITTTFSYKNKATNEVRTNGEYEIGDYTVTATITISGTAYTLTKDFSISENTHSITNNCSGLYLNRTTARPFDEVHISVAPGINPNSLSVVGATTNLTLDNYGIRLSQNGYYWFQMPDEDVTVNAEQTDYSISVSDSIEHGSVTASVGTTENATTATNGDTVILNVTPDDGYTVSSVTYNDGTEDHEVTATQGVYSFEMPAGDVTVSAVFVPCISNVSVTLKDDLGLNFIVGAATAETYGNYSIKLTGSCAENGQTLTLAPKVIGGNTVYCVTASVSAHHMDDTITAKLYEGETLLSTKECSINTYLTAAQAQTSDSKLLNLIAKTRQYGEVSYAYFNTPNSMPAVTSHASDLNDTFAPNFVNGADDKLSLVLNSKLSARLYIKGLTAGETATYGAETLTAVSSTYGYYFEVTNILPTDMASNFTIIYGENSYTFKPLSWSYRILTSESPTARNITMANALYEYYTAALAYSN